jgi:hypothetical protein
LRLLGCIIELSESHGYCGGQDMKRTWMPRAAGILCITLGVVCVLPYILINIMIIVVSGEPGGTELPIANIAGYWIFGGIVVMIPIVGGIYALRRRAWGLALAGSICALILGIPLGVISALFAPWLSSSSFPLLAFVVFAIPGILAIIFVVLGKGEFKAKAPVAYERDIETNPNKAYAYYARGDFFYKTDEYDLAIPDYSKAIQFNPNYGRAYYGRGLAYREKGEVTRAVNDLEKCIELSTDTELTKAAQQALSEIKNSP